MGYREGKSERCEAQRRFHRSDNRVLRPETLISADEGHSAGETRLFCIGRTARGILMVRFTYRGDTIRIIGAGYWRKGRRLYEKENRIES
jgi:hypothetical protein